MLGNSIILLFLLVTKSIEHVTSLAASSSSSSSSLSSSSSSSINPNNPLPNINAAVIIPGFLTGADDLQSLADNLTARGIPSICVPFPNWHWIPCLGGRSARPILERIDHTVRHLSANGGDVSSVPKYFDYSIMDCIKDFKDNPGGVLAVGGSAEVDEYPKSVSPRGDFMSDVPSVNEAKGRVAIVGHSAGGWIGRVYLSQRDYGGRVYGGSELVHSIVTLGSPHLDAPGAAFRSVHWINQEEVPENVRGLAVAGKGLLGDSSGQFTQNAYEFCLGGDGTSYDGDGVTPVQSSLAMDGVNCEKMVLEGAVTHFPWSDVFGGDLFAPDLAKLHKEQKMPWYGSNEALDQWADWLKV